MGKLLTLFFFLAVLSTVLALIPPQDDTDGSHSQGTEKSFNSNEAKDAEENLTLGEIAQLARSFWTQVLRPAIYKSGQQGALSNLASH